MKITEEEKKQIEERFESIFDYCKGCKDKDNEERIRKAFRLAYKAHDGVRRRSGEPYIIHPVEVAIIAAKEIGLGAKSVISALLHDVVEDTDYTLEDISNLFGEKIANIIDGLTKIPEEVFDGQSMQAENFRKTLLTLSDDVRVILIKLADRLHNMRTLESMPARKQYKIASETSYLYAPLAHRLGLYQIKTELEDLSFKYTEPVAYKEINEKLKITEQERSSFVEEFAKPIREKLKTYDFDFEITGRTKSVYSIWKKMQKQGIKFEEVYDIFAVRIVFQVEIPEREKMLCWNIYTVIAEIYSPIKSRLRDWITTPKSNGYESLHTTVMGNNGKHIEVQIRSNRMNEIAEKGYAAHWKYKSDKSGESELDIWINKIQDLLKNQNTNALDFLDDIKASLYVDEVYVFDSKGNTRTFPKGSTVLDFAYAIHTDLAESAYGAKINHGVKIEPLNYKLKNGDKVEILRSSQVQFKPEWENFVVTSKAKSDIRKMRKKSRQSSIHEGIRKLEEALDSMGFVNNSSITKKLLEAYEVQTKDDLYLKIFEQGADVEFLRKSIDRKRKNKDVNYWELQFSNKKPEINVKEIFDINEALSEDSYKIAPCCNPIPGDAVLGLIELDNRVSVHKTTCKEAEGFMSRYGDRIVSIKWKTQKKKSFLASVELHGRDRQGVLHDVTRVIYMDLNVNMRAMSINALDGVFIGHIDFYVHDTEDLNDLISKLEQIKSIRQVRRV